MTEAMINNPTQQRQQTATSIADPSASHCDEALISRQRQRYLVSLVTEEGQQSDNRYREQ